MEINKQLFEDVLSGKLKGVFVLRDGTRIESYLLSEEPHGIYKYNLDSLSYTQDGCYWKYTQSPLDIFEFLPVSEASSNERNVGITLENACELYHQGGDFRKIALQAFSEDEIVEKSIDYDINEQAHWLANSFSARNGYSTTEELLQKMGKYVKNLMLDTYKFKKDENV